jgi:AcrR family transcriptional regulator
MSLVATADEKRVLIEAGLAVLRRRGTEGCTVAAVLTEAGLSTRAFYRHFDSKDTLILAIYEHDSHATQARLRARLDAAISARAALELWIDETLALGFDARRARRTRPLAREGMRLEAEHPAEFARIVTDVLDPLVGVLRRAKSPEPERDARSIHAVTWSLVEEKLAGGAITRDEARAHALRFCRAAIAS